jgi:hypothetical protein
MYGAFVVSACLYCIICIAIRYRYYLLHGMDEIIVSNTLDSPSLSLSFVCCWPCRRN